MPRAAISTQLGPIRTTKGLVAVAGALRQSVAGMRTLLACRNGSTMVEAALTLPVLLAFVFCIIEAGRAMWIQNSLQFAVEDAARCAAINATTCGTTTAIQTYAAARADPFNISTSAFTVSTPACGKQVSASYAFDSVAGNLLPFSLTLTAQSCHPA